MGVDVGKMKKSHKDQQKGGDFGQFEAGETLIYVCPPCREVDEHPPTTGLCYVPIAMHYKLGPKEGVAASLDPEINPVLKHPYIRKELKRAGKLVKIDELEGKCPIQRAIQSGKVEDADESRAQTRFLWNFIPLKFRKSAADEWNALSPKVTPFMIGKSIYEPLMEAFFDNGDITDPSAAVLIRVGRKGAKLATKYTVKVAPETLKKPFVLGPKTKAAMLKALAGDCDLFKIAAGQFKSPVEISAMLKGLVTTRDPDEDEDEEDDEEELDAAKARRREEPEDDEDEDEDDAPPKKKAKKKPADDEEESDDEEEEEKSAPNKSKKKPVDEDEDEDDSDDEDEEDEKPAPKKGKKAPPKDEDEDEDDSDDEDEEPAPKKKAAKKKPAADDEDEEPAPKKKAKKGEESTDEEEDVEGLEELEQELAALDGKKGKKGKKAPPKDEDEDEDDE